MKVKKSDIPADSLINKYQPFNYRDSFECEYKTNKSISPDDILVRFWTNMPEWVNTMFKLRNILVKPFGLETDQEGGMKELEECIRSGKPYRWITVPTKSSSETVLCMDDKHLAAYISVHIEKSGNNQYKARCITVVQFKYWLGYAYFYAICPFHYIIVKAMFKHTIENMT